MRLVIQRVLQAEVQVNENTVGKINKGLLVFVGAGHEDCRMIDTTCISFILRTKETFWIAACFRIFCCCDRFWIFFRFGKINGNINFAIRAVYFPFLIFLYTIAANIVAVLA